MAAPAIAIGAHAASDRRDSTSSWASPIAAIPSSVATATATRSLPSIVAMVAAMPHASAAGIASESASAAAANTAPTTAHGEAGHHRRSTSVPASAASTLITRAKPSSESRTYA